MKPRRITQGPLGRAAAMAGVFVAAQLTCHLSVAAARGARAFPSAPAAMAQGAPAPQPAAKAPPAAPAPAASAPPTAAGPAPLVPRPRDKVKQAPAPTPEQVKALEELQKEADAYERDAKDYRGTMTRIVKHHYEEKRRRILDALDREIKIESDSLKAARDEAIKRLEAFVAKYSGDNAHPKSTPDAMFRLAALLEEREREAADEIQVAPGEAPPAPDLKAAIAMYKRLVNEFPQYDELAGVFYYLGHAYNDMGRLEEAQQVFRALVCRNHFEYPVPPDPADAEKDSIARMPQDHDQEWWYGWMSRHGEPLDASRGKKPGARRAPQKTTLDVVGDEETYRDPYPTDCAPLPQKTLEGDEPRYLAEVWWRIADYHFDEIDPFGGAYNLNRAESSYHQAMSFKKPPVFGVAMYKLAWTFYKQQRYEAAVKEFVELLHYTDKREQETGNPGADFRSEAYAYIAGSLTYVDFEGPGPNDPYIARNDVFDTESDAAVIEQKMHVAIDRIQDEKLVPQDKKWTVEIYKALAFEFKEYNHFHNSIEISELILKKWPMHRDAPFVQNQIAETYEVLAGTTRGAEHDKYSRLALEARGKLVSYVATPGVTPPWVEANKEDPEAIRAAERLVRGGLRRAAADHTNAARANVKLARSSAEEEAKEAFAQALVQYDLAAKAWGGYLLQDENSEDAYESRFWLADAHTNLVLIKLELGQTPTASELDLARRAARDVRDSNEDDKYLQPSALMLVRIEQQIVASNYKLFEDTNGARGFKELKELEEQGEGEKKTFVKKEIPTEIKQLIASFDEYVARVPVEKDPFKNHEHFAYTAGEIPFFYGQFEEAKQRLTPIYVSQCGSTKYGYLAWEKLITMANQESELAKASGKDPTPYYERSRELAQSSKKKSCAVDAEMVAKEKGISDPTIQRGFFQEASKAYKEAQAMAEGPDRKKAWRKAAELYEGALREAPQRDEAPEAAILGASAYKQIGEYDKAIAMYELFIKEYGKDDTLSKLEKGDPAKGTPPNKKKYDERVKFLKVAYDALAEAYVLFFDYRRAATTFETIAKQGRFEDDKQREAARNAVFLYASIGDRPKMEDAKRTFLNMNPPGEERAEVEWLIASADLKDWDERGPTGGTNGQARQKAITSMDGFYRKNSGNRDAYPYAVQAAYHAAKMRRVGGDPNFVKSCENTIDAFDNYKSAAGNDEQGRNKALTSIQADMAAECHFRDIDEEIKKSFDYDSGHHRYKGVITDVQEDFKNAVEKDAKGYFDRLQEVISKYESRRWAVAARARQGSLYDSTRTGLYNAREPGLKLYNDKELKLLKELDKLCTGGSDIACEQHDTFTANRRTTWKDTRDRSLADADRAMVAGYAESILWAKAWKVRVDAVDQAINKLAFYTEIIGDPKLRDYSSALKDPQTKQAFQYRDKMFLGMRRGMTIDAKPDILASPLPVVP